MMKAHGNEENDDIDRISSLPDEVCTHILSFVSTREAVQTSILSKRWINTWTSVPDLKFGIKEFGLPKIFDDEMDVEESLTKFELILRSALEKRYTSCVNRFQLCSDLKCGWPCTPAIVDCIGDVIKLGPRVCLLEMCACSYENVNTDVIFSCASLIYLQFQLCQFSIEVDKLFPIEPNSVNLPCLKTLNLARVELSDDHLKKLLLGCPVLEELVLEGCYIDIIEIYSNTLKKLVLCYPLNEMRLQISTPNLLYLDISGLDVGAIMLLNMPSLVDASIIINAWSDQDGFVAMGPKLIHSLSNVECLQLEFNYPDGEVLMKDFSDFPIFNNLKRLKLLDWSFYGFGLAPYFLLHSPKLQELTLARSRPYTTNYLDEEITKEDWGDALVQREFLKTVRIVGFKNDTGFVDQLINKLLVHVKIIGEIDIV